MIKIQQGDVLLFQTNDDGEINVDGGLVEMSGGLSTAAYLSLFGGNEADDGSQDSKHIWWGNVDENEMSGQYRSETQNLLRGIPATSGNLRRIEDAARRDLSWFLFDNIASTVNVTVSIPALNRVRIVVDIEAVGEASRFIFIENWEAGS